MKEAHQCIIFYLSISTETWYLVCYEADNNLRVLGREEIRHIFPDDDDDAINVGDIVSAICIPNGQFYDAKI